MMQHCDDVFVHHKVEDCPETNMERVYHDLLIDVWHCRDCNKGVISNKRWCPEWLARPWAWACERTILKE